MQAAGQRFKAKQAPRQPTSAELAELAEQRLDQTAAELAEQRLDQAAAELAEQRLDQAAAELAEQRLDQAAELDQAAAKLAEQRLDRADHRARDVQRAADTRSRRRREATPIDRRDVARDPPKKTADPRHDTRHAEQLLDQAAAELAEQLLDQAAAGVAEQRLDQPVAEQLLDQAVAELAEQLLDQAAAGVADPRPMGRGARGRNGRNNRHAAQVRRLLGSRLSHARQLSPVPRLPWYARPPMSRSVTAAQILVDTGLTRATFFRWRKRGWIRDPTGEVATGDSGPPLKTWPPEVIDEIRARLAEREQRRQDRARKRLAK